MVGFDATLPFGTPPRGLPSVKYPYTPFILIQHFSPPGGAMADSPREAKQCRICLAGPEEEADSGRLIKPCLCRGSMQYVHIKCLNKWRLSSGSKSAFYSCDTCHYSYAFARTRAVGLATSPAIIAVASLLLFTAIVFLASFSITLSIPSLATPSYSLETLSTRQFLFGPVAVANRIISFASSLFNRYYFYWDWGYGYDEWDDPPEADEPIPFPIPQDPKNISLLTRLAHRFFIGLSAVGSFSFVAWIWQMSLLGPLRLLGFRSNSRNNRRDNAGNVLTIVIIVFVVIGVARALRNLYRMNRRYAQRILASVEDVILEVP